MEEDKFSYNLFLAKHQINTHHLIQDTIVYNKVIKNQMIFKRTYNLLSVALLRQQMNYPLPIHNMKWCLVVRPSRATVLIFLKVW